MVFSESVSFPVQVDHIVDSFLSAKTRCAFFRVEIPGLIVLPDNAGMLVSVNNCLLVTYSRWAAITGISLKENSNCIFESATQIDRVLDLIDRTETLMTDIGYIWVPNSLLQVTKEPDNGDVYRLSWKLFSRCYSQIQTESQFLVWDSEGIELTDLRYSPIETAAFREWREQQVAKSRERYHSEKYSQRRMKNRAKQWKRILE